MLQPLALQLSSNRATVHASVVSGLESASIAHMDINALQDRVLVPFVARQYTLATVLLQAIPSSGVTTFMTVSSLKGDFFVMADGVRVPCSVGLASI